MSNIIFSLTYLQKEAELFCNKLNLEGNERNIIAEFIDYVIENL